MREPHRPLTYLRRCRDYNFVDEVFSMEEMRPDGTYPLFTCSVCANAEVDGPAPREDDENDEEE